MEIPYGALLSKDGQSALSMDSQANEATITDLKTGTSKKVKFNGAPQRNSGVADHPQADGRSVIRLDPQGRFWLLDATSGKSAPLGKALPEAVRQSLKENYVSRVILSPDHQRIAFEQGTNLVAFDSSGTLSRHPIRTPVTGGSGLYGPLTASVDFLADGTLRYSSSGGMGVLQVTDWNPSNGNVTPRFDAEKIQWKALGGKLSPVSFGGGYPGGYPGGYGNGLAGNGLAASHAGGASGFPQKSGPEKESILELKYSPALGAVVLTSSKGRRLIQDIDRPDQAKLEPVQRLEGLPSTWGYPIPADEHDQFGSFEGGKQLLNQVEGITCIDPSLTVAPAPADCPECRSGTGLQQSPSTKLIRELAEKQLCTGAYDSKSWDQATGPISAASESRPISRERADLLWLRFQRLGAVDPEKHGPVVLSLLRSDLARSDPAGTRAILQSLHRSSAAFYNEIIARNRELLTASLQEPGARPRCQTDEDRKELLASAKAELEALEKPIR
jgi:hypothetical protein